MFLSVWAARPTANDAPVTGSNFDFVETAAIRSGLNADEVDSTVMNVAAVVASEQPLARFIVAPDETDAATSVPEIEYVGVSGLEQNLRSVTRSYRPWIRESEITDTA